jgi:hypothetical protein
LSGILNICTWNKIEQFISKKFIQGQPEIQGETQHERKKPESKNSYPKMMRPWLRSKFHSVM